MAGDVSQSQDFIIVGAGIVGAMAAYRLASQGYSVLLVDKGPPGGQASRAAAGILSPSAESGPSLPFFELLQRSFLRYPALTQEIEEASHMSVDLDRCGVIQAALDETEETRLQSLYEWQKDRIELQWVTHAEMSELEPDMKHARAAVYAPKEMQVHAPKLVQALVRACHAIGVTSRFGVLVQRLMVQDHRVWGVETNQGRYFAEKAVIIAAGSWAPSLVADLGDDLSLPIKPVRGQVLSLTADTMPMRHIVFAHHRYVVPKPDGRLIVGATEDDSGFDDRVSADGVATLAGSLNYFGPRIRQMHWDTVWAGLRPMAPDGLPVLGPWAGWEGLFIAGGHFRNGILLAAATADIVVDWAQDGTMPPEAFRPERFARS